MMNVGHEIRTPLTGMIASTSMLKAMQFDTHTTKLVDILHRSSERLANFVNNVLDLTKADVGQIAIMEEKTCLHTLVEDVLDPLRSIAKAKGLNLVIKDHLYRRTFKTDSNAVQKILRQLLENAIKFTDCGSVIVLLGEDAYGQVKIDVSDTGIGIEADRQALIFQEFGRAVATIARDYGGNGLGLAIVKSLTEKMQGQVTVKSTLGEGSTFTVLLPFAELH